MFQSYEAQIMKKHLKIIGFIALFFLSPVNAPKGVPSRYVSPGYGHSAPVKSYKEIVEEQSKRFKQARTIFAMHVDTPKQQAQVEKKIAQHVKKYPSIGVRNPLHRAQEFRTMPTHGLTDTELHTLAGVLDGRDADLKIHKAYLEKAESSSPTAPHYHDLNKLEDINRTTGVGIDHEMDHRADIKAANPLAAAEYLRKKDLSRISDEELLHLNQVFDNRHEELGRRKGNATYVWQDALDKSNPDKAARIRRRFEEDWSPLDKLQDINIAQGRLVANEVSRRVGLIPPPPPHPDDIAAAHAPDTTASSEPHAGGFIPGPPREPHPDELVRGFKPVVTRTSRVRQALRAQPHPLPGALPPPSPSHSESGSSTEYSSEAP